jgi:hypothetical protein
MTVLHVDDPNGQLERVFPMSQLAVHPVYYTRGPSIEGIARQLVVASP